MTECTTMACPSAGACLQGGPVRIVREKPARGRRSRWYAGLRPARLRAGGPRTTMEGESHPGDMRPPAARSSTSSGRAGVCSGRTKTRSGRAGGRGRAGFGLVELSLGAAIVVVGLGVLVALTVVGTRSFGRGRETLDLVQRTRGAFVRIQRDVRSCAGKVEVDPEGTRLTLEVQRLQDGLQPEARPGQGFTLSEIVWSYDPAAGTLMRGSELVSRDFPDLEFRLLREEEAGVARGSAPMVEAVVTSIVGDRPVTLRAAAVPRFMASWSAHPGTVYAPLATPLRFTQEE